MPWQVDEDWVVVRLCWGLLSRFVVLGVLGPALSTWHLSSLAGKGAKQQKGGKRDDWAGTLPPDRNVICQIVNQRSKIFKKIYKYPPFLLARQILAGFLFWGTVLCLLPHLNVVVLLMPINASLPFWQIEVSILSIKRKKDAFNKKGRN